MTSLNPSDTAAGAVSVPNAEDALQALRKHVADIIEYHARLAASVDRSGEAGETSTKIEGSTEGESAVPANSGETPTPSSQGQVP